MGSGKQETINLTSKIHFIKLHSRVRNKYEEMQIKLEKSKARDYINGMGFLDKNTNNTCGTVKQEYSKRNINHSAENLGVDDTPVPVSFADVFTCPEGQRVSVTECVNPDIDDESSDFNNKKQFDDSFEKYFKNEHKLLSSSSQALKKHKKLRKRSLKDFEKYTAKVKKNDKLKLEDLFLSNTPPIFDIAKNQKRIKMGTLTFALIEAKGMPAENPDQKSHAFYFKIRLGSEKRKSKNIKNVSKCVQWQELFNLSIYEDYDLEISIHDKDICIGSKSLDLRNLQMEKTHKMHIMLSEENQIDVFILITISGTSLFNLIAEQEDYDLIQNEVQSYKKEQAWYRFKTDDNEIGFLSVIVFGARGLYGNDCYCTLQVNNDLLRTHTENKTSDPNWMKHFKFVINDVTSILEISVYDEKKSEEIGRIWIPLLKIKSGLKKWYGLKDSSMRHQAKGINPQILLEMSCSWDLVKASLRVISPKEVIHLEKEDEIEYDTFSKNLARAKLVVYWVYDALIIVKTCFEWESKKLNCVALVCWLVTCWCLKAWMVPLLFLIPFYWYKPEKYRLIETTTLTSNSSVRKDEKEEKTLRQRIHSIQEMVQSVQNFIGDLASFGETVKNLFNYSTPYLSYLAIFLIIVIAIVMFLIPIHYIFMIWGVHKFARKILRPNRIPNNEILDLLSRVPDDEILLNCEELPLEVTEDINI